MILVLLSAIFSLVLFLGILFVVLYLVTYSSNPTINVKDIKNGRYWYCGSCKKEKTASLQWTIECTGSCSETDMGDYRVCPECSQKHQGTLVEFARRIS